MNTNTVQFLYFDTKDSFLKEKKSINKNNTQYIQNNNIQDGTPNILWGWICFIKDTQEIYLNGQYYTSKYNIGDNVTIKPNVSIGTNTAIGTDVIIGHSVNIKNLYDCYILGDVNSVYNQITLPKGFNVSTGIRLGNDGSKMRIYNAGNKGAYFGDGVSIGEYVHIISKEKYENGKYKFYIDLKDTSAFPDDSVLLGRGTKLDEYIKITEDCSKGQINIEGKKVKNIKFISDISIGIGQTSKIGEVRIKNPSNNNEYTLNFGTNVILKSNVNLGTNATIGAETKIGDGVEINTGAIVRQSVQIGTNVSIGQNAWIGTDVNLGTGIIMKSRTFIGTDVSIGQNVQITDQLSDKELPGYVFGDDMSYLGKSVYVWPNVWLGTACNIDEHVIIGEYGEVGRYTKLLYDADNSAVKLGKNTTDFDDGSNTISIGCGTQIGQNVQLPDNLKIEYKTAEEYALLDNPDSNTLYFIVE